MSQTKPIAVKDLSLDLENFRTVKQPTEIAAIEAIVSTSPDRFWALTDSLVRDGYLPTESVIVLEGPTGTAKLTVKEGNRRIAAMKLLLGLLPANGLAVPSELASQIKKLSPAWKSENSKVPCTVYKASDAARVDRIVTLAHGKGEKAGRDQWNAVARARHNRDVSKASEPALDLLEKYLADGQNSTPLQKSRWAGDYPVTVLEEAMKKLAPRLGLTTAPSLAAAYPNVKDRGPLENIIAAIGRKEISFEYIRAKDVDFAAAYGVSIGPSAAKSTAGKGSKGNSSGGAGSASGGTGGATGSAGASAGGGTSAKKPKALATSDPKAVRRMLKSFAPKGKNREKVVDLKNEAVRLDVGKTPLAFSFLLRSMFEVSAKAYCGDHSSTGGPKLKKADGSDRPLVEVLRDITKHLTNGNADKEMTKVLHGAMTELGNSAGLLSVTSMNQLVHNPKFSIVPSDVATRFSNIFPLLEAMNR